MPPSRTTKKDMIIDVAMSYIASNGMTNFSTRRVAEDIGCSEALIYRYYPTKKDLIDACLDRTKELDKVLFREVFPKATDGLTEPIDRVRAIYDAYLDYHIDHWAETLAFEQLKNTVMAEKLDDDFEEYQQELFDLYVKEAGIDPYMKELNNMVSFFVWWAFMVQTTIFFVRKVRDGVLPNDKNAHDLYFTILSYGTMTPAEEC